MRTSQRRLPTAAILPPVSLRSVGLAVASVALIVGLSACGGTETAGTTTTTTTTNPAILAGRPCHSTVGHIVSGFTGTRSARLTLECVHTAKLGDRWVPAHSITTPGCISTTSKCPAKVATATTAPTTP